MALAKTRELRIGIIGAGDVVELFHLPALLTIPGINVSWVSDPNQERAERVATAWKIPEFSADLNRCSDVNVVLIATPVGTRRELVLSCLKRGWSCFCEKPFAVSLTDHLFMLGEATKHNLLIGSAYLRRFYWSTGLAKRMIEAECLGRLEQIFISEPAPLKKTGITTRSYRNDPKASGGGVLAETGCHSVDQALYICGAQEVEVTRCLQTRRMDFEIETLASGLTKLSCSVSVPFSLAVSGIRDIYDGIVLQCANGQLRLHDDPKAPIEFLSKSNHRVIFPNPRATENLIQRAFRDEWLHFLKLLDNPESWACSFETGVLTTSTIDQCYSCPNTQSSMDFEVVRDEN